MLEKSSRYYSNVKNEEFDRFVEFLGGSFTTSINQASHAFISLEEYIFPNNRELNFANHNLTLQELTQRFNRILVEFAEYEKEFQAKQYRFLSVDLVAVKNSVNDDLFKWSYYNHKFAASQGQDMEAMKEWHSLDSKLDINQIARFKNRRETNMAFYMHILRNNKFFDAIYFSALSPEIKSEIRFGLDVAEEQYLHKLIRENQAQGIARIVEHGCSDVILNLFKNVLRTNNSLKGHILSNSRKLNKHLLLQIRNLFEYLNIQEVGLENTDFVLLVNDLDLLSLIPEVNSDKPIFAVDLSEASTPNFSYLLLKDSGFNQVFGYAKKHKHEENIATVTRSLNSGLMFFVLGRKFKEQIAANYMDDYFSPLAQSLGKGLKDFENPLQLLRTQLGE